MMEEGKFITRRNMLRAMDVRYRTDGRPFVFSVKFVQLDGKLRYFPQCTIGGAGRMASGENRMRGLTPCDCVGAPIDHTYAVRIDNIVEFQKMRVVSVLPEKN